MRSQKGMYVLVYHNWCQLLARGSTVPRDGRRSRQPSSTSELSLCALATHSSRPSPYESSANRVLWWRWRKHQVLKNMEIKRVWEYSCQPPYIICIAGSEYTFSEIASHCWFTKNKYSTSRVVLVVQCGRLHSNLTLYMFLVWVFFYCCRCLRKNINNIIKCYCKYCLTAAHKLRGWILCFVVKV